MSNTRVDEKKPKEAYKPTKFPVELAEMVQLSANAETSGNFSEMVRRFCREGLDRRLHRPNRAA